MKFNQTARLALLSGGVSLIAIGSIALTYDILKDGRMGNTDLYIVIGAGVLSLIMSGFVRMVQAHVDKINIPHYEGNNGHHKGVQHAYVDGLHIISMRSQLMAEYDLADPEELKTAREHAVGLIEGAERVKKIVEMTPADGG